MKFSKKIVKRNTPKFRKRKSHKKHLGDKLGD